MGPPSPPSRKLTVEDAGGNTVTTSTAAVTLAINTGTGTLACTTNPVTATAGVATFAGCKITVGTAGTFTLKATATGLTTATSASFTVAAGPATKVVFTASPASGTGGTAFATQPRVAVEDAGGNTVTTDTSSVTLAIGTNPGTGTLTCTANPKAAVAGVATFAGCSINQTGTGYTLTATDGTLTSATTGSVQHHHRRGHQGSSSPPHRPAPASAPPSPPNRSSRSRTPAATPSPPAPPR